MILALVAAAAVSIWSHYVGQDPQPVAPEPPMSRECPAEMLCKGWFAAGSRYTGGCIAMNPMHSDPADDRMIRANFGKDMWIWIAPGNALVIAVPCSQIEWGASK